MTDPGLATAGEPGTPEPRPEPAIRDSWSELTSIACAHREDWDEVAWLGMIGACRDANLPYREVYAAVMRLNWDTKTSHANAYAEIRALGRKLSQRPARRGALDPGLSAALRAGDYARAWAATHDGAVPPQIARATGPQQALTPENDDRRDIA